jgi:hypothetical protein
MPPIAISPLIVVGAVAAVAMVRLAVREFHRINAELDALRTPPAAEPVDRSRLPTLRRDPLTGDYRPS